MNILATINTGDFMCQNVRDSFKAAAARWGCEYVEITEKFAQHDHPFSMKLELPKYPWPEKARVFFVEGDILIRDDCPNPFEHVPPQHFAAAQNDQGERDGIVCEIQRHCWETIGVLFGAGKYKGFALNTGVFMFEPDLHSAPFAAASNVYELHKDKGVDDQTCLSLAVHQMVDYFWQLDRRWNCVGPIVWMASPKCPAWITHFAKYGPFRDGREDKLKAAQWQFSSYDS